MSRIQLFHKNYLALVFMLTILFSNYQWCPVPLTEVKRSIAALQIHWSTVYGLLKQFVAVNKQFQDKAKYYFLK